MRRSEFEARARVGNHAVLSLAFARASGIPARSWHRWTPNWRPFVGGRSTFFLDERPSAESRLRAALDELGDGAGLGGVSALWAWELSTTARPLEVVASHGRRHRDYAGVQVVRSRTLRAEDIVEHRGWSVTTPERTLLDLAARRDPEACLALVIDAIRRGLVQPSALASRADLTPTAPGAARLRDVVARLGEVRPDSILEWWVRERLVDAGLAPSPGPRDVATPLGTFSLDLVIEDQRIAIECDGRQHLEAVQARRDARKANALALSGWRLLRTDFDGFLADPDGFVRLVVRAAGGPHPPP